MLLVLKLTKHSVLAGADSRNLSFPLRRPGSQLQNQHPVSSQKQTERATQWVIPTMGYRKGNFSASWRDLKKWPDHDAFTSYFYIILPLACMLFFFFFHLFLDIRNIHVMPLLLPCKRSERHKNLASPNIVWWVYTVRKNQYLYLLPFFFQ